MKMASPAASRALPVDAGSGVHDYQGMTTEKLERRREEEMSRQDGELEAIHTGVNGLKQHAIAINEFVVEDVEILKDIDHRTDTTQGEIQRGTDKAIDVNKKKAKVCKLYGLIAVLVAAEIVLSAAGIRFI